MATTLLYLTDECVFFSEKGSVTVYLPHNRLAVTNKISLVPSLREKVLFIYVHCLVPAFFSPPFERKKYSRADRILTW